MEEKFMDITLSAEFVGERYALYDKDGTTIERHYVVNLEKEGREIKFDYCPSIKHPVVEDRQDILEALECFLNDCQVGAGSIADFQAEFGVYGPISQFLATYNACHKSFEDFNYLMDGEIDVYDMTDKLHEELGW